MIAKNEEPTGLLGKKYLIFGGSEGIGLSIAKRLAKEGGSVHLIARNMEKGTYALKLISAESGASSWPDPVESGALTSTLTLKALDRNQSLSFTSLDTTDIKALDAFCKDQAIAHQDTGIDGIVLCAGGLNYGPRRTTSLGLEVTFAQNYFSRFLILYRLSDALQLRNGRAIHCLGAGNGGAVDTQDWQLEKTGSSWSLKPFFLSCAEQYASMGDLMVTEFTKRYPAANYFHLFPGVVNTNSAKNQGFPAPVAMLSSLFLPMIAKSPDSVAAVMLELLTLPKYNKCSSSLIDPHGGFIPLHAKVAGDGSVGDRLWEYSVSLVKKFGM